MPFWSLLVVASVVICGIVLTVRVLRRGGQTGGRAELLFAFSLATLLVGFGCWVFHVSSQSWLSRELAIAVSIAGEVLTWIGCAALFFGTWRFYRPQSRACGAVAALFSGVHLAAVIGLALAVEPVEPSRIALAPVTTMLARAACFAWWGGESILYYRKMRRRVDIGLADAIVTSRFLMLGVSSLCLASCMLAVTGSSWIFERQPREIPLLLAAILLVASVGAFSAYCAFLQPQIYRRVVERRTAPSDHPS